ncbi:MAG: hypothetical protein ACXVCM_25780, partial [Ktedonobacteraceae bacterium]
MQHEDGMLWGYRALVPGTIVIDHAPVSDSKESLLAPKQGDTLTEDSPEDVIDEMPCISEQAPLDECIDAPIEDDEDTAQRPAVKIASATVPLIPLATAALNGHDTYQTDVVEVKGEDTVVSTEETNDQENAVEIEDSLSIDNDTALKTVQVEEEVENSTTKRADSEIDSGAEDEEVVVKDDVEQEEKVVDGDHLVYEDDQEAVDSSQRALVEPEDAVGEVEIEEEGTDLQEEKLDSDSEEQTITDFSDTPKDAISSTEIVVRESLIPAVLPLYGKNRKRINIKKVAQTRRSIRKRWIHDVQSRRQQRRFRSIVATTVVASLMFVVFLPLGTGLAAYSTYNSIRNVALDGVDHLLTVKTLLPISKSDPTAALDAKKLQQAQLEFSAAESDFVQLQQLVNRSDVQSAIQQFAPQYSSKLDMAQRLVQVGIDVSRMGKEVVGVALLGANIMHSSPLANGNTKPLITSTDISNAEGVLIHAQYFINDIQMQMSQVSIKDLPISTTQKKELSSVLTLMPKVQDYISQGQGLIGIVAWLLGVDHARHVLVQTMDNGELRPGGGFTGMYGLLTIQNGRMAPFSLQDVT